MIKNLLRAILGALILLILVFSALEYKKREGEIKNIQKSASILKARNEQKIALHKKLQDKKRILAEEEAAKKEAEKIRKKQELLDKKNNFNQDTQFVMLAFDGSRSNSSWEKTLSFAQEMREQNIPLSFTYFISGVYLLPKHQKNLYNLSWKKAGSSDISFGDDTETTNKRIDYINKAIEQEHEIASHLNGHFDGTSWTYEQWLEEINVFAKIINNTLDTNIDRKDINIDAKNIIGMRSPLLSKNSNLYRALADTGYRYDTSKVNKIGSPTKKDSYGIW